MIVVTGLLPARVFKSYLPSTMILLTENNAMIEEDGEYALPPREAGCPTKIEWEIDAGSATIAIGEHTVGGNFRPLVLLDASSPEYLPEGGTITVNTPYSRRSAVKVTGATEDFSMSLCSCAIKQARSVTTAF